METLKLKICTVISAFTVATILLTTALPGIPAHALSNPSENSGKDNTAATTSTGSAVEVKPALVAPTGIDYSKESNASLRMKPLKEKLAALTTDDLSKEALKFKDINKHWCKVQVSKMSMLEIVNGYPDGTFKPVNSVTVAEFTAMVVKVLGYRPEVDSKNWAKNFISTAIKDGLYGKADFTDYNRPITREEVAKIAVNASMLFDTAPKHDFDMVVMKRLRDYSTINNSLKQKVIDANLLGLMSTYGETGKFLPKNSLTRAEAATVVLRLLDNAFRAKFEPKKTEMITGYNKRFDTSYVLVNNNVPEVLPMAYRIIEASKKSKGYAEIVGNSDNKMINISFYDTEEQCVVAGGLGCALDITIKFGSDSNSSNHPYTIAIRDAVKTKALHMEFIKEIFNMFYGDESAKVLSLFNKSLESCIMLDDKAYDIWTYRTGVKFDGRGIMLGRNASEPIMGIWIYSK